MQNPIAITGLLVAAMRAEETRRSDRLFEDRFADALATELGRQELVRYRERCGPGIPIIEVRTRYFDEAIVRTQAASPHPSQVVILAAGMDARAYRLAWRGGTRVFELDQPEVIAHKAVQLAAFAPQCERVPVPVDLRTDWTEALEAAGFVRDQPSLWLVEGLLQYLERASVQSLFARVDALTCGGSSLLFDLVGETLLAAQPLAPVRQYMSELGAPWLFGSDDPHALLNERWTERVSDPAVLGNAWKRWPFPAAPAGVPGVPRGHLIEAFKR